MSIAIGYHIASEGSESMKLTSSSAEDQLIAACRKGDRLGQKYLYQRYYGQMIGICIRYTKDRETATEVLNMAFLKIFKSIDQYESTGSFGGWVARIVYRTCIDHIRSNTRYNKAMDFESEADISVINEGMNNLAVEEIMALVNQLPPATRAVFNLYAVDGFKHREIAEQLDITEGTSKWHLNSARKQLQALLSQQQSV